MPYLTVINREDTDDFAARSRHRARSGGAQPAAPNIAATSRALQSKLGGGAGGGAFQPLGARTPATGTDAKAENRRRRRSAKDANLGDARRLAGLTSDSVATKTVDETVKALLRNPGQDHCRDWPRP